MDSLFCDFQLDNFSVSRHYSRQFVSKDCGISNIKTIAIRKRTTDYRCSQSPSTIKEFLEFSFDKYVSLKKEFGLNHIIEYYISAIRQRSLEEEFLAIVTAFECLNDYIVEYALKNNVVLESGDMENKKNTIRKVSKELDLNLDEKSIEKIAMLGLLMIK